MSRILRLLAAMFAGLIVWISAVAAPIQPTTLNQPASRASWTAKAVLLSVANAGQRLVAVGERGFVLLSNDNGRTWRQAAMVPTSVTLTRVSFATPTDGWAVGHMGVVLHTTDGGDTWVKQLDGNLAANLALADAKKKQKTAVGGDEAKNLQRQLNFFRNRSERSSVGSDRNGETGIDIQVNEDFEYRTDANHVRAVGSERSLLKNAESLVRDGPDKPFLSLLVIDSKRVLAFGAFGFAFTTDDGGKTWLPIFERVEESRERHLYGLAAQGGTIYATGEQGTFLRSRNGGRFEAAPTPYEGTLFGVLAVPGGGVLTYGLRGALLRTDDAGAHWTQLNSGVELALTSGLVLADGHILLGSQSGELIESRDGGRNFSPSSAAVQPVAGLAQAADGAIIVVGPRGIARVESSRVMVAK